jgi:hypothetical protein
MSTSQDAATLGAVEIDPDLPDVTLDDIRREQGTERLKGMSVSQRMALSYMDMRATTRALIEENPGEARLLFFVLLSDVIFFLSRGLALVISPGSAASERLPLEIGLWLVAALFLRTAVLYGFSAFVAAVCRVLGGRGSWRDTRAAVFWASLVAAPIGVVGALIVALFAHLERLWPVFGTDLVALPPLCIGIVAFVFFLSAGVAEAQRFPRNTPVFVTFSLLTIVLGIGAIFVHARYLS